MTPTARLVWVIENHPDENQEIFRRAGVGGSSLSGWRRGTSSPTIESAEAVCKAMGVKLWDALGPEYKKCLP